MATPPFNHEYKEPDEIIIGSDEQYEQSNEKNSPNENQKLYTDLSSKSPFFLRLLCVVGCTISLICVILFLFLSIAATFAALFTFFQKPQINLLVKIFWQKYTNALLIAFGFALGILNPLLGLRYLLTLLS